MKSTKFHARKTFIRIAKQNAENEQLVDHQNKEHAEHAQVEELEMAMHDLDPEGAEKKGKKNTNEMCKL